jgi:hypothetical protein
MGQPREPFSYERHQDVAALLDRLHLELERLGQDLGNCYGAGVAAQAFEAVSAVDKVRETLHGQLQRDFPPVSPNQVCGVRLGSIYVPARFTEHRRAI